MIKRILIIDDEQHIRQMMRLTLEAAGYAVGEAQDGDEGLRLYDDGSDWDGVVLDQRMPGMDGLETLRRLKVSNPEARIVMATAYASIELAVDALKLGATDFLRKPMTPETLRGAVQAALGRAEPESTVAEAEVRPKSSAELIPTITLNGFEIVRPPAVEDRPLADNEYRFLVKIPGGQHREVLVEIAADIVSYVERMTRRRLPASNSFWEMRAERFLGDYLWNEGKTPPGGRLTLSEIDQTVLPLAATWSE